MDFLKNGIWQENSSEDFFHTSEQCIKIDYNLLPKESAANRYVLYTSLASPLAHASVLIRTIKKLERVIGVCIVSAEKGQQGWEFKKTAVGTRDRYNDCQYLHQIYTKSDENYSGIVSLPLIWDNEVKKIISNCPFDVMHFINGYFNSLTESQVDLYPSKEDERVSSFIQFIIEDLYVPIHKAAYVTTQGQYDLCSEKVFQSLDELESLLQKQQTLIEGQLTVVDWLLFSILIRFDVIFVPLFKLNKKQLIQYAALTDYMTFLYQEEHIGCTANIAHMKEHYYKSYVHLNNSRVIPSGPQVHFDYLYNRFGLF